MSSSPAGHITEATSRLCFFLWLLITAVFRYNSHTIQITHLKYTIHWFFSVLAEVCHLIYCFPCFLLSLLYCFLFQQMDIFQCTVLIALMIFLHIFFGAVFISGRSRVYHVHPSSSESPHWIPAKHRNLLQSRLFLCPFLVLLFHTLHPRVLQTPRHAL